MHRRYPYLVFVEHSSQHSITVLSWSQQSRFQIISINNDSMADLWQCHLCFYVHVIAITPACTNCGHPRCTLCPLVQSQALDSYYPAAQGNNNNNNNTYLGSTTQATYAQQSSSDNQQQGASRPPMSSSRQDMRGWWRCCNRVCRSMNNPALTAGYCSACGHQICASCTRYR